jgi:apolipoprotein N-acyltransferase
LVVTPETAIPVLPQQLSPAYWQTLNNKYQTQAALPGQAMPAQLALIGMPMGGANVGYSNSVLALGQDTSTYRYDKQHLVPFGEFVPPFFQWFVRLMNIPLGDFGQQRSTAGVLTWQGQRLLPQICYEDLFGEEVAKYFANADQAPTVLVNMSNLAWFGNTTAPAQHAAISQLRALEFQRPVIRATNTGLTALIDAKGEVKASLPVFTRGALVGEFEGRTGLTPYAQWTSQWGLWPLWLLCGLIVLVLGAFFRRARSQAI